MKRDPAIGADARCYRPIIHIQRTAALLVALMVAGGCRGLFSGGHLVPADKGGGAASAPGSVGAVKAKRPSDAVPYGLHWYKAFDEDVSWHEAKKRCEALGGYLACIETEGEQAFITKLAGGRYLSLGATDEASEGQWVWINGSRFEYTCWMSGQPNNYGDCEHFLATYDGGDWVDVADDGDGFWMPTGYICEWDR